MINFITGTMSDGVTPNDGASDVDSSFGDSEKTIDAEADEINEAPNANSLENENNQAGNIENVE